ncbi:hypothetical protein BM477_07440 [Boudabousia marimammalium]|uniref:Uncharacterized protein n=2 Tax=Boudabousia marimammalium TaxID=156892 RepID=A0A1Q5PJZ1_9ACTO|nr:hypothetical protein BM477_07440 [Boudabousia marimammalium]
MELTQNLFWVNTPDIDGIKYDYDGGNTIYNSNYKKTGTPYLVYYGDNTYSYGNSDTIAFGFDKNFQLTYAMNRTDEIDLDTVDIEELKREIYRTVQPVIDAQYAPLINLQWLYDWVNKDKFN